MTDWKIQHLGNFLEYADYRTDFFNSLSRMEEQNMCTAATYKTNDFYFGRTLDYEISYGDQVVITPRNYVFDLREGGQLKNHYAMIGMACVMEN